VNGAAPAKSLAIVERIAANHSGSFVMIPTLRFWFVMAVVKLALPS